MPATDSRFQLVELLVGDAPEAWARAGFDVHGDHTSIGGVALVFTGTSGERGLTSAAIGDLAAGDLDGVAIHDATRIRPEPGAHPNGITGIDHLVVATPDCDRTTRAFAGAGLEIRRVRRFGRPGSEMRQTFFWLGDVVLELVGSDVADGDGPATLWGLALTVPDIDATAAALGDHCSPPKDAVQPGRRIATVATGDLDISTRVAVMSPHRSLDDA